MGIEVVNGSRIVDMGPEQEVEVVSCRLQEICL